MRPLAFLLNFSIFVFIFSTILNDNVVWCGSGKSSRVIGGRQARPSEVPYIVSIQQDHGQGNEHICGGSIFNPKFIITAAHCIALQENLTVIAGTLDRTNTHHAQVVKATKATFHPLYKGKHGAKEGDIGLLELAQPLMFSAGLQPIPIPPTGTVSAGKAVLSGWGRTVPYKHTLDEGDPSEKLMTVELKIVPKDVCAKMYREINKNDIYNPSYKRDSGESEFGMPAPTKDILCAGGTGDGKSSCKFDSGGPLQCTGNIDGKVTKYLCGLVSYGYGCGTPLPGGYTELAPYHDWILENTN